MGVTGGLGRVFAAEKLISLLNPKTATKYTSITSYDDLAEGHHDITPQRTELDNNTPYVAVDIPSGRVLRTPTEQLCIRFMLMYIRRYGHAV